MIIYYKKFRLNMDSGVLRSPLCFSLPREGRLNLHYGSSSRNAFASCKSEERNFKRYLSAASSGAQPSNPRKRPRGIPALPASSSCLSHRLAARRGAASRSLVMQIRMGDGSASGGSRG
jgi:hypothetical protein